MEKTYIDLQDCHATQTTIDGSETTWAVKKSNGEVIDYLPSEWSEKDVMKAIHFARKFELIAFNAGIDFMKQKKNDEITNIKQQFDGFRKMMKEENERLAFLLEEKHGEKD